MRGPRAIPERTNDVSDLKFDDPCVVFALRREARAFLREFRPHQRFAGAPCRARFCGPAWLTVLVLETGPGADATQTALDWLLNEPHLGNVPYRPKVVLSAGFAGALAPDLKAGDLVLATDVGDADGNVYPAPWPPELPAGEWRPPLRRGRVLTVPRVVSSPDDKRALGGRHQALAADMESATAARLCKRHGVPFGCLRVVLDDLNTPLSERLTSLVRGGRVSPLRTAAALATSPRLAAEMWRLAKLSHHAGGQLARALGEVLTLTLPFSDEL